MKARGKREARRPWLVHQRTLRPEGPKYASSYYALSGLVASVIFTRGDVLRFAQHLPLAFIFRAFGAVRTLPSYQTGSGATIPSHRSGSAC